MIISALIIMIFGIGIWCLGTALLLVLKMDKTSYWLSMPLGLAILAIVVNYLYFAAKLPVDMIKNIVVAGYIVLLIIIILYIIKSREKKVCYPLLYAGVVFIVLLFPAIIGGKSFYISGIGFWDDFSYMSLGLLYEKFDYNFIQAHSVMELAQINDVLADIIVISQRPSVSLIFSLIISCHAGDFFALSYGYVLFGLVIATAPFCWIISVMREEKLSFLQKMIFYLAPAAYILGFWGQLMLDFRVWSCIMSLGIIYGITFYYCYTLKDFIGETKHTTKNKYILLIVLITGSVLIYPEHFLFIALALGVYSLIALLKTKSDFWKNLLVVCSMPVIACIIAIIPNYQAVFSFAIRQLKFAMGSVNRTEGWQSVFLNYLNGLTNAPNKFLDLMNRIPALCGFYFITPNYHQRDVVWAAQIILLIINNICTLYYIYYVTRKVFLERKQQYTLFGVWILLSIECVPMIIFYYYDRLWNMGRAMQYSSGLLFTFLLFGLLQKWNSKKINLPRIISFCFIILNLFFFILKSCAALYDCPAVIKENYISIYQQNSGFDWNIDKEILKGHESLLIDIDPNIEGSRFYIWYIKLLLTYENIDFSMIQPLKGMQTEELENILIQKNYDGVITLEFNEERIYEVVLNEH